MNLFNQPSLSGLHQLVETGSKSLSVHNIVVDYDGEVIIDPEMKFAGIGLNRFKFHTQISHALKNNKRSMKNLLETLVMAYSYNGLHISLPGKLKHVA
jgi:hypothetical protein